ncbi:hypothetical protein ABZ897_20215 [Nonomuraea sp. NPDC046802]|uniref:hypothetical protein n=1 Tax=Nonomuraea sp. NPDC046802 TaxID=3154919 RepID=UPI0033E1C74E
MHEITNKTRDIHDSTEYVTPRPVRIAQGWMFVQAFLGMVAGVLLVAVLAPAGPLPGSAWAVIAVCVAFYIGIGVLAGLLDGRNRWVRVTALILEILLIIQGVLTMVTSPNLGTAVGLTLAVVAARYLCHEETARWLHR